MKPALLVAMLIVATAMGCRSEPDLTGDWYGNWFGHWHDPDYAAETRSPAVSLLDRPAPKLEWVLGERPPVDITQSGWPGQFELAQKELPSLKVVKSEHPVAKSNHFLGSAALAYRQARSALLEREFDAARTALDGVVARTSVQQRETDRLRYLIDQAESFWSAYQEMIPSVQPGDLLVTEQGFLIVSQRSDTELTLRSQTHRLSMPHEWKKAPASLAMAVVRPWLVQQGPAADKVLAAVWAVDRDLQPHRAALHAMRLKRRGMDASAVFEELGI